MICFSGSFAARALAGLVIASWFWALTATAAGVVSGVGGPGALRRWLLVDTGSQTLTVMQGSEAVYQVKNIAIGSNGTGTTGDKRIHDEKTPLGDFTINSIRNSTHFHRFVGFDYPTMDYADAAVADGRISQKEYAALSNAWHQNLPIPQNTGLGGHFGIHGVGAGNARIHKLFNWTDGCIALTNEEIEQLVGLIDIGTPLTVR